MRSLNRARRLCRSSRICDQGQLTVAQRFPWATRPQPPFGILRMAAVVALTVTLIPA